MSYRMEELILKSGFNFSEQVSVNFTRNIKLLKFDRNYCLFKYKNNSKSYAYFDSHSGNLKLKNSDNFFYGSQSEAFVLQNRYFEEDVILDLDTAVKINITNCYFAKGLYINDKWCDKEIDRLYLNNVIVEGKLRIHTRKIVNELYIGESLLSELELIECKYDIVEIYGNEIKLISFCESLSFDKLLLWSNYISDFKLTDFIKIKESYIELESFLYNDKKVDSSEILEKFIDSRYFIRLNESKKKFINENNKINYETFDIVKNRAFDVHGKKINSFIRGIRLNKKFHLKRKVYLLNSMICFIDLLLQSKKHVIYDSIINNITINSSLKYLLHKYRLMSSEKYYFGILPRSKLLSLIFGNFYNPRRILISSGVFILIFGLVLTGLNIYHNPSKSWLKLFSNSIYHSIITFYTIGYGDLKTLDNSMYAKPIVVFFESITGVIFNSSLITTIINRYKLK